jgi:DNA modification methylase
VKDYNTWFTLIKDIHPESVLDPFAGSCAIGEVCESLGIPWLGIEKNPQYYEDVQYRVNLGRKRYIKQQLTPIGVY